MSKIVYRYESRSSYFAYSQADFLIHTWLALPFLPSSFRINPRCNCAISSNFALSPYWNRPWLPPRTFFPHNINRYSNCRLCLQILNCFVCEFSAAKATSRVVFPTIKYLRYLMLLRFDLSFKFCETDVVFFIKHVEYPAHIIFIHNRS